MTQTILQILGKASPKDLQNSKLKTLPSRHPPIPPYPSPPTKIVALTASVFEETKSAAAAIGCDDFLRKPIQENTLLVT